MKPVAIFRFSKTEHPGRFGAWLTSNGIPWQLVPLDEGAPVPESPSAYSGIGMMGGPMSVNDKLPWIAPMCSLLRDAISDGTPVIGHCLGGQILARAAGGKVTANPVKEIGWNPVRVEDTPLARRWFGAGLAEFTTFQWHGETFSIPPGAERILTGRHCPNQAYVLGDRHLGLQCHVEMTPEMIASWIASGRSEIEANLASPAVQPVERITADMRERLPALSGYADRLYARWVENLKR